MCARVFVCGGGAVTLKGLWGDLCISINSSRVFREKHARLKRERNDEADFERAGPGCCVVGVCGVFLLCAGVRG